MPVIERNGQMHVKSYFAASVLEAMEGARRDLGPDALLLNSREAPPEASHLGAYEVVFGIRTEVLPDAPPAAEGPDMADLYRQIRELRDLVTSQVPGAADLRQNMIRTALVDAGLDRELAQSVEDAVRQRMKKRTVLEIARPRTMEQTVLSPADEVAAELAERFEVAPEIGRITALVGPPGSGKTTALVKLAVMNGLMAGRAVRIYSADTHRIGAVEQMRTYAGIIGVPFESVEGAAALSRAIDSAPANALILIDTAGYSSALLRDVGGDIAAFLSRRQDIDKHLTLTATLSPADMTRIAGDFLAFGYSKLLFTMVDEATSYSAMLCEAIRRQRPISFLAHGQSIPEDIQAADKSFLLAPLVRRLPEELRAVA